MVSDSVNMRNQSTFAAEDFVVVPEYDVVLASGGPLMRIEVVEGDSVLCRWEEDGKTYIASFGPVSSAK